MKKATIKKKAELISKPGLRERGWTDTMIRRFLPVHDAEKENPYYKCAGPMKLYKIARIKRIEKSSAFIEALEKSADRQASAYKAVSTKFEKIMEFAKNVEIEIPIIPQEKLIKEACYNYNDFKEEQAILRGNYDYDYYDRADKNSDEAFLARICQNHLRHNYTDYDEKLEKLFGKVGVTEGHDILKERINNRICHLYPWIREGLKKTKS